MRVIFQVTADIPQQPSSRVYTGARLNGYVDISGHRVWYTDRGGVDKMFLIGKTCIIIQKLC